MNKKLAATLAIFCVTCGLCALSMMWIPEDDGVRDYSQSGVTSVSVYEEGGSVKIQAGNQTYKDVQMLSLSDGNLTVRTDTDSAFEIAGWACFAITFIMAIIMGILFVIIFVAED